MATVFTIKEGDTLPAFNATLLDASNNPVDLTGATAQLIVATPRATSAKVTGNMTLVDAAAGTVRYDWVTGDTDSHGQYYAEIEVTFADGSIQTFPTYGYVAVQIVQQLP